LLNQLKNGKQYQACPPKLRRRWGTGGRKESGREREWEKKEEKGRGGEGEKKKELPVTRVSLKSAIILAGVFLILLAGMWFILDRYTDSPVPGWDSFITSLSIIATWMLARKIYEHWYLWLLVNSTASILFFSRGLYPTLILYLIYTIMSFAGLKVWRTSLNKHK